MGPQANLTAKEVARSAVPSPFGWLSAPALSPPRSRWDGRSAFWPRFEKACITAPSVATFDCSILGWPATRYVYDNRIRSNTLRWHRDADC